HHLRLPPEDLRGIPASTARHGLDTAQDVGLRRPRHLLSHRLQLDGAGEGSDELQEVTFGTPVTDSIRTSGVKTNTLVPLIFTCPSLARATQSANTVPWQ